MTQKQLLYFNYSSGSIINSPLHNVIYHIVMNYWMDGAPTCINSSLQFSFTIYNILKPIFFQKKMVKTLATQ